MTALQPLVVACLRHTDQRPEVDPLTGSVRRDVRGAGPSPAELAALELALRIAEAWSGRVLAVTAGESAADETLRQAHAAGAAVLRVPWPADGGVEQASYPTELAADERPLARAIAGAVRVTGEPALVLCGDRSSDRGTGALPAYLAAELGAAQALGLVSLVADGELLVGQRRLDGGRRECLRIPRPAVCSVEAAGVRLRRASLPATLAAGRLDVPVSRAVGEPDAPVTVLGAGPYRPRARVVPPPAGEAPQDRLAALTGVLSRREPPTVVGPVGAEEAADVLLGYLVRHGYLAAGAGSGGEAGE